MMSAKYYIYAGGRWCEVDTRHGRVAGWRARARFCFVRGGRLHAARSGRVLRGLRALAAGAPGVVRDAAPLPRRRLDSTKTSTDTGGGQLLIGATGKSWRRPLPEGTMNHRSRRDDVCPHTHTQVHHCCAHSNARCDVNANDLCKPRPATPLPATLLPATPLPATSSPAKRRRISSEETKVPMPKSPLRQSQVSPHKSRKRIVEVSSSQDVRVQKVIQKPAKRMKAQSSQRDIDVIIVGRGASISDAEDKPQAVKGAGQKRNFVFISDSGSERAAKSPVLQKKNQRAQKQTKAEKFVECLLDSSESEVRSMVGAQEGSERCKELVIEESDVELLRKFLATQGGGDLERFDRDERYKLRVFHRLNPLVTLQRCQPLENLLRQRMTLKEFARNLGLRSVAEVTPEKRYRMRRSTKTVRTATESDTDKENVVQPKRRRLWNNNKELFNSARESRSSELKNKPQIPKPVVRESSRDTSDSDTEFKRRVKEQLESKERERPSRRRTRSTGGSRALKEQNVESLRTRQTRMSNRNNAESKAKQSIPSDSASTKSATVKRHSSEDNAIRRTRSSLKKVASPVKPKLVVSDTESGNMKLKLARVSRSVDSSEWEVVSKQTKSSSGEAPAATLNNQKEVDSNTDSAFERKSSPKKANLIRKAKPMKIQAQLRTKDKDKGGSKAIDKDRTNEKKTAVVKSVTAKPLKVRKTSVPLGREYTSLEDHAIVAWVCGGDLRARRVNGNRLWRELALDYPRLTGQSRSWHSLRNRYLRYVLPALGALALPPAQVSRLRAAAATGEIKSRGAKQRRNSIFAAPPVRSASAAVRQREKEQGGGRDQARGKGGRWLRAKEKSDTPKEEAPPAPRVTRSSLGSPLKGTNAGRTR